MSLRGEVASTREILGRGTLVSVGKLPGIEETGSHSQPLLGVFELEGLQEKGVIKPVSSERPEDRADIGHEYLTRSELAAAWVAEAINYDAIPATRERKIDVGDGNGPQECLVTQYLENTETYYDFGRRLSSTRVKETGMAEMLAFDLIIWNTDRQQFNTLINPRSGRVHPIDQGLAFGYERRSLRVYMKDSENRLLTEPVDEKFKQGLNALVSDPDKMLALGKRLSGLLTSDKVDALRGRLKMINNCLQTEGNLRSLISYIRENEIQSANYGDQEIKRDFYEGKLHQPEIA